MCCQRNIDACVCILDFLSTFKSPRCGLRLGVTESPFKIRKITITTGGLGQIAQLFFSTSIAFKLLVSQLMFTISGESEAHIEKN